MIRSVGRLLKDKTAFFCCDVQERFVPLITNMPSVIHVSKNMVKAARILQVPVIVTEQYPKALGKTVPEVGLDTDAGSSASNAPQLIHVFEKTLFSMMTPPVKQLLDSNYPHVKSVVLFGIESHVCVLQTTLDLLENGYDVHILADGVSSMRKLDRSVAIERMRQAGAFVSTSDSVLFQLCGDAKHPNFKEISALVKEDRPDTNGFD